MSILAHAALILFLIVLLVAAVAYTDGLNGSIYARVGVVILLAAAVIVWAMMLAP